MEDKSLNIPPWLKAKLRDLTPHESDEIAYAWQSAGQLSETEPSDAVIRGWGAEVWNAVHRETAGESRSTVLRLVTSSRLRWFAAAAVVALLVAVGAGLFQRTSIELAPLGQTRLVTLPDGTLIELNSGSMLEYRQGFGATPRTVRLDGEAFFQVEPSETPFRVETFNARVTVLGTEFNVRAWPEEQSAGTEVTLESGRVSLALLDGSNDVELKPGEFSVLPRDGAGPAPPVPVQVANSTAWRDRGFVLIDRPLSVVLAEMQRRFDIQVSVQHPEMMEEMLSVVANAPASAEVIVQDIGQYLGYTVAQTAEGYELRSQ